MSATYVTITRQRLEDWLFDLCPVFERVEDTKGVFLVPLSRYVAVKVSTTLASSGRNTPRGEGRCRMVFVSRHGGRTIHGADGDTRACNRTSGWAENWKSNLKVMFDLFREHKDRYHELARMEQPEYAKEWIDRIESIKNWESFDILGDLRKKLVDGAWLTPGQEGAVWKFARPKRRGAGGKRKVASGGGRRRSSGRANETARKRLLIAVDRLKEKAAEADDSWVEGFCEGLRKRLKQGRDLTKRQRETLDQNLKQFGVKIPAAA